MKPTITVTYSLQGVQSAIHQLLDREGISEYDLAKRAGLSPTSIYLILRKDPNESTRPVRRSTLQAIGNGVGYEVTIDSVNQRLIFRDRGESLATTTVVQELLDDIRGVLLKTDIKRLSKAERDRLKEVVRVMVKT
jgi:transcriptional regulator with XRE-family HTH domain